MSNDVADLWFLYFAGAAFLVGPVLGVVVGRFKGFEAGIGAACLVIGLTGLTGAVQVSRDRWQMLQGTVAAEGRLVEYRAERHRSGDGKITVTQVPVVRFSTPDGISHEISGLGGSQANMSPGDPVPVRYLPADPEHAIVADVQNAWGAVIALILFGVMPTLFGLFFLLSLVHSDAASDPNRFAPAVRQRRERLASRVFLAGNLGFVGAIASMVLRSDDGPLAIILGQGFVAIGAACLIHLVGTFVSPQGSWMQRGVLFIVAVGFGLFGGVAWLLG